MNIVLFILSSLCIAYGAMVLIFWVGVIKLKKEKVTVSKEKIPISIVIAFRNEAQNLSALLSSIERLNYPQNLFEVILVNDHSDDNWQTIIEEWKIRLPNLKVLSQKEGKFGKKFALAYGIENAVHNHIAFTDADCILHTNWLVCISNKFSTSNSAILIGPVILNPTNSFFSKMQGLEHSSLTASTLGGCRMGVPFMASSANLAFNIKQLGFNIDMLNPNTQSGDDVFLLHYALEKGFKVSCFLDSNGIIETKPVKSLNAFLNQRARWASKSKHYTNITAITVALIVLCFNVGLLMLFGLSFFYNLNYIWLVSAFSIKLITDFLLLNSYLEAIGRRNMLWVFIPLQLIYPFYIAIAFLLSLFKPIKWK